MNDTRHRVRAWMPLYPGDYLASTGHLTTEEHGAYLLLLFHYWSTQAPLPDDDGKLARITKLPHQKWKQIRGTITEFFIITEAGWTNERIDAEIAKAIKLSDKRRQAGKRGAKNRWGESEDSTEMANAKPNAMASAKQELWQPHRPSPSPTDTTRSLTRMFHEFVPVSRRILVSQGNCRRSGVSGITAD